MTKRFNELDAALNHFAETYFAGVVGSDWEEACDMAETVGKRLRCCRSPPR